MAILRPLLSLVNGAAVVCGTTAESLNNLSASARSNRATLSSMASECLVTQTVLERLEGSLGQKSQADDYQSEQHNFLHGCFEIVVQAVKMTIVDVDCEIKRLKRYSRDEEASLLDAKPVPVLQDPFSDARSSLRRNRSSLNLVLDCAQSGILAEAEVQLRPSITSPSSEKGLDSSRLHPEVTVILTRQTSRPNVQQLMARVRSKSSRPFRSESKLTKKLHEAIANGNYGGVCKYLCEKADPNALVKGSNTTPIHRALSQAEAALGCENDVVSRDLLLIVTVLILAGANLSVVDESRRTPLLRAVKSEMRDSLVALMLEFGASANATDKEQNTALHYAAMQDASHEMGNVEVIRMLIAYGADQSIKNKRGRVPLYEAVMWKHLAQATELLDYGADLEIADNNGWTALYGAVIQSNVPLTRLLCDRGAFADKKDKTGQTALHYAVSQGQQEIVEVLVKAGADVNLTSKGETPLCRATAKSNASLISYLVANGADVSVPSPGYNGALPIHLAAIGKDTAILDTLINGGSPIDALDGGHRTPLAWAMESNKNEIVHFLMSHGATAA